MRILNPGILLLSLALASCATKPGSPTSSSFPDNVATYGLPVLGGTMGAVVAGDGTKEKAMGAAIGGIGGAVVGQLAFGDRQKQTAYSAGVNEGYQRGVADSTKRQYWALQKSQSGLNPEGEITIQEVDIPATKTPDGRFLMPRTAYIPTVE
jgi:hypothetical protein